MLDGLRSSVTRKQRDNFIQNAKFLSFKVPPACLLSSKVFLYTLLLFILSRTHRGVLNVTLKFQEIVTCDQAQLKQYPYISLCGWPYKPQK